MTAAATKQQYPQWEYDLLRALQAPVNTPQLQALNYWAAAEGLPADTNNFLAITDPGQEFGATGGDPAGALANGVWNYDSKGNPLVVTFPSLASGISALVSFLQHGHTGIVDALRDPNATVQSIAQAVQDDGAWGNDGHAIAAKDGTTVIYRGGSATGPNGSKAGFGPSSFYQCNSANTIIGEGGIVFGIGKLSILNPCQAKAIVGGLIVGFGVIVVGAGVFLLSKNAIESFSFGEISKQVSKAFGQSQETILGSRSPSPRSRSDVEASTGGVSDRMILERILNNQWADRNPFPREKE